MPGWVITSIVSNGDCLALIESVFSLAEQLTGFGDPSYENSLKILIPNLLLVKNFHEENLPNSQ